MKTKTSSLPPGNRKQVLLFTMLFLFLSKSVFPQLSGTYTLGNDTSDFPTFQDAVSAMEIQGLAGDVTFEVSPGIYHSVNIDEIQNDSSYSVKFVYNGTTDDSAVITGQLYIRNSNYITFKGFNIYPDEQQDYAAIYIITSKYCVIDSCKIINLHNNQFDYFEGLIHLKYEWDGPYIVDSIKNSVIKSTHKAFAIDGKKGVFIVMNSEITGSTCNVSAYVHKRYYNNRFYCTEDKFSTTSQGFYNNTFYGDSVSSINIKAALENNVFKGLSLNISSGTVTNNVFYKSVSMAYCGNAKVTGNIFLRSFRTIYSHGIKIRNNVFYENVSFDNDNTWFGNNLVYDTVQFLHGPGQMIVNNNFTKESYLESFYTGGVLINNNIGNSHILQPSVWRVENNNFINLGYGNVNIYGENAHFYNPGYTAGLRSTNLLLTGKGKKPYSLLKYDIDGVLRKNPCSIGANEVCYHWIPSVIDISCGDSVVLDICRDSLQNEYWSPAYLFGDTLSTNPVIYPQDSVTVYLVNKNTGDKDSLHINVNKVAAPISDIDFTVDNFKVAFYNNTRCADSCFWDFGDGETSQQKEPVHQYTQTGNYTCLFTASNSAGVTNDTLNIIIASTDETCKNDKGIKVYPNPATTKLYVESENTVTEMVITGLSGKTVAILTPENKHTNIINIETLPQGIYFLKVKSGEKEITVKFVK